MRVCRRCDGHKFADRCLGKADPMVAVPASEIRNRGVDIKLEPEALLKRC